MEIYYRQKNKIIQAFKSTILTIYLKSFHAERPKGFQLGNIFEVKFISHAGLKDADYQTSNFNAVTIPSADSHRFRGSRQGGRLASTPLTQEDRGPHAVVKATTSLCPQS